MTVNLFIQFHATARHIYRLILHGNPLITVINLKIVW